jgi:predicted dinucleotide-binding enzyme
VCSIVGNYYPQRDGAIEELDSESITESQWVEKQLGHSVVKVFNNIGFPSLNTNGKPTSAPGRIALPVAGDNAAHKATVMALLDQIGFDGVDAGELKESWRQQPGTPVYCTDWDVEGVKRLLNRADRNRSRAVQELQTKAMFAALGAGKPTDQLPLLARALMAEQYPEQ